MAGGGERTPSETDAGGPGEESPTPSEEDRSSEEEIDRYIEQVGRFIPRSPSPADEPDTDAERSD